MERSSVQFPAKVVKPRELAISVTDQERAVTRIEELAARHALIRVPNDDWTERKSAEISDCVNKPTGDIARKDRTAVIRAVPERGKACTAFGEHIPRQLEST